MPSKKIRFAFTAAAVAALLAGGGVAQAQVGKKKTGDKRVAAALDQAELKYEVTDRGDFKLLYELDDDRTQVVIIGSKTEKLGDLEIREVWSIAQQSDGEFDGETANALLVDNGNRKVGAWQVAVEEETDQHTAIFSAQVDAAADSAALAQVIVAVVQTADEMENELTEEDEF